jgi:two-component system, sensor histidine kinase
MQFRFPTFGIMAKILAAFLVIALTPLIILGYLGNRNLSDTALQAVQQAEHMGREHLQNTKNLGAMSVADSVRALDRKSTEAIELRTVETAARIADFLRERDKDILTLALLTPDATRYLDLYRAAHREVIVTEQSGAATTGRNKPPVQPTNPENVQEWRHTPPVSFPKVNKPLYREITFIDLQGRERIKIRDGRIDDNLLDVSKAGNTFCRAEQYFRQLKKLKKGEIYVSEVIGAYVPGWIYKTGDGIKVKPESAHAGRENPGGRKFEGIIRWATPYFDAHGQKTGYLTMALDHVHVMEFTDHLVPTEERFTVLSDGGSGNYAFIWDHRDRSIAHARDFFISGFDPKTGRRVPGWLSQDTFNEYKRSGLPLVNFSERLPSFRNFTQKKQPAVEQIRAGRIPLDCRILDTAPQCEGWHVGTEDGGSGSFVILWSGLWKLTTYAAIPYYTGQYGQSRRGFGYVTIGANVEDFHKDATITKGKIEQQLARSGKEMAGRNARVLAFINEKAAHNRNTMTLIMLLAGIGVVAMAVALSLGITKPLRLLTEGARAMGTGKLEQTITVQSADEIGQLATTFNEMAKSIAELDKMKSDFVTIASHELRTPIQAMLLSVSGILEGYSGEIDEEVREDLQVARQGIERLMRLVESLLNLSRIESRKVDLQLTPTSVDEIIEHTIAELADLAGEHHHTIIRNLPEGLPQLSVDRDRIIQVMINLLSNAIKYNPDGGSILLGAELAGDVVRLTVADNGYGVPPWATQEIFKKFFQADSIMSHKVGGTGLGLTISKGIVELHNGTIECHSPLAAEQFPGLALGGERHGSLFVVTLPLEKGLPG